MHRGTLDRRCECMTCFGELSNNSPRRIVKRICSEGCPKEFYRKSNNVFSRTKIFFFENSVFSHLAYACARESERAWDVGKDESHSHP